MLLEYYLFVTYIFVLVCAVAVICKYLFADVKRQRRMLDEKEKQLLTTYRTLEDAMEEYYSLIAESREEIETKYEDLKKRLSQPPVIAPLKTQVPRPPFALEPQKQQLKSQHKTPAPDDTVRRTFEQLIDDAVVNAPRISALHEKIIAMSKQGKARAEIAKELKITQTEVDLVSEMHGGTEAVKAAAKVS